MVIQKDNQSLMIFINKIEWFIQCPIAMDIRYMKHMAVDCYSRK